MGALKMARSSRMHPGMGEQVSRNEGAVNKRRRTWHCVKQGVMKKFKRTSPVIRGRRNGGGFQGDPGRGRASWRNVGGSNWLAGKIGDTKKRKEMLTSLRAGSELSEKDKLRHDRVKRLGSCRMFLVLESEPLIFSWACASAHGASGAPFPAVFVLHLCLRVCP